MRNLVALCAVLETSLSAIVGDDIEIADNAREQLILKQFRALSDDQQSALLALAATMTALPYSVRSTDQSQPNMVHEPRPGEKK